MRIVNGIGWTVAYLLGACIAISGVLSLIYQATGWHP